MTLALKEWLATTRVLRWYHVNPLLKKRGIHHGKPVFPKDAPQKKLLWCMDGRLFPQGKILIGNCLLTLRPRSLHINQGFVNP